MKAILSNWGVIIEDNSVKTTFGKKYGEFLRKLTVVSKQKVGPPKVVKLYKQITLDKPYLVVPRNCLYNLRQMIEVDCRLPPLPRVAFDFQGELYENQVVVRDYLMREVYNGAYGNCTLNMGAGLGKTATAAGMIQAIGTRTLYIAKDRFLQKQAYGDLVSFFPTAKIAKFDNKKYKSSEQYDITIIIVNSAMLQDRKFYEQFGLIIVDEIHAYCGQKRSELFWNLQSRYLLGMSATTNDRNDHMDTIYHHHFGRIVHAADLPGFDIAGAEFQGVVKVIKYMGPDEYAKNVYSEATGMLFTPGMIALMTKDEARNRLIVKNVAELWRDPQRYIYVFSEYREHLDLLAQMIRKEIGVDAFIDDGSVNTMMGGIKEDKLAEAVKSRIILTTYTYGGTGISIKHMNAAVFGTPRRNGYKQICARIMRRGSDVSIVRIFIDIVDQKTMIKYQHNGRKQAYDHYGFGYEKSCVSHENV